MMKAIIAFCAMCIGIFSLALTSVSSFAAPQSLPAVSLPQAGAPLSNAGYEYRNYCVSQYFTCRDRWGGGHRFERCMRWRGCWEAYVEFRERREERKRRRHRDDYVDEDHHDNRHHSRDEGYSCSHWRNACSENWGYGNSDYYGCLRYHGCE